MSDDLLGHSRASCTPTRSAPAVSPAADPREKCVRSTCLRKAEALFALSAVAVVGEHGSSVAPHDLVDDGKAEPGARIAACTSRATVGPSFPPAEASTTIARRHFTV